MPEVSEALMEWRKRGGGPKTDEGKKRSSRNAMQHGCRSAEKIMPGESEAEYLQLWHSWLDEYMPETPFDLEQVEDAVDAKWRLKRAERAVNDVERAILGEQTNAAQWGDDLQRRLQLMQRYRTTAENSYQKSLRLIVFLRRNVETARVRWDKRNPNVAEARYRSDAADTAKLTKHYTAVRETIADVMTVESAKPFHMPGPQETATTRMHQAVIVQVIDGEAMTTVRPSNERLLRRAEQLVDEPQYVTRRFHFPDGIPADYQWAGLGGSEHRGECGVQRMTFSTWLDVVQRESEGTYGHVGPTGVGNLSKPAPVERCACPMCLVRRGVLPFVE